MELLEGNSHLGGGNFGGFLLFSSFVIWVSCSCTWLRF